MVDIQENSEHVSGGFCRQDILWAVSIWMLYRIIKGWLYLYDNKPLANPRGWF